jgi:hypothetical protein
VCSEDRSGFIDKEQCIGAPFCNAALANQGQSGCTDAPCEAGLMQCNGAQLEICRDDRTGLDPLGEPCESAALCNADNPANGFCEEPLCRRGATSGSEFRCEGSQLQRCNESLTVYDNIQTCVTPALCDASQRFNGCRPPVCRPGQFNCASGFLQVCNPDQTGFDNLENCGSQAQCDANAGRCADPCEPGSTRCNASNGDLERCNDRLTGWQPIADCPNFQLCDAQNARCRICVPDDFSCADGQLRQCDQQGRGFARVNIPPECAPSDSPSGSGIRACDGNRVVVNPCTLGCQQPQNRCRECNPGQTQCVGNGQMRTCGNDGFYAAPTNCSDGNFCNGTETCQNNRCAGGAPPSCDGFGCQQNRCNNCNGGRCASDRQFMTCDNGLLSTPRDCPSGQTCQGGGNCLFNCGALNCNDNNPCTNDTCSPQAGCQHSNVGNGTNCSNGNACDGSETCQNGQCRPGAALNCNDNNPCTNDSCNPQAGCQRSNVPNRSQCVNGDIQSCNNGVSDSQDCGNNGCNAGATSCNACNANTPATCVNGQRRVCVNGQFQNQNCPQGQQCQNGACVNTQICTPNSASCTGNTRTVCNAQGTAQTTQNCPLGCNGTACRVQVCTPGSFSSCSGASIVRCNALGSGTEVVACPAGQACGTAQQSCVALPPGIARTGVFCPTTSTFVSCTGTTLVCSLLGERTSIQCPAGTSCSGQSCQ